MDLNEYQRQAATTAQYPSSEGVNYCIHGLTNEAGEVAGKYKKFLRGDKVFSVVRTEMEKELGDVLWYVAMLARELGVNLNDIAEMNLAKLAARKSAGTIKGDGDNR